MTPRRNRRAGVEDRWRKADGTPSKLDGQGMRWRARWVDPRGRERAQGFRTKAEAQRRVEEVTAAQVAGSYVDPADARLTVDQWAERWLEGYKSNRASTVRQAKSHLKRIRGEFGPLQLSEIRPSMVKAWCARMRAEGLAASTIYAHHARLSHLLDDAVHDGILPRNPCSRRTSPPMGGQRPYVATTEQIWALYDAVEPWHQPAVLLGAFAGLRPAEISGLRVEDIDFMRGVVHPTVQWPDEELKTEMSRTPVPIPQQLALLLSAAVAEFPGERVVTDGFGGHAAPWTLQRVMREARPKVEGLPEEFRFHDLRHYYASLLIAAGTDVKVVQARLRHASAKTTLDTYGHLWPNTDESTRTAIGSVISARVEAPADGLRTDG